MWISSGDVTLHVTMRRTRTADTRLKPMSSIRASRMFSFACRWHFVVLELCSDHAASHWERIVLTIGVHHGHDVVDCAPAQCVYVCRIRIECMYVVYSYYLLEYNDYNYLPAIATDMATNTTTAATLRQSCSCCLAASPAASGCCRFVAVSIATAYRRCHRHSSASSQRSNMRVITV